MEFTIRQTLLSDLPKLSHLPPTEWNFDITAYIALHFSEPYFVSFTGIINEVPVAIGSIIFHNEQAWLGTIIVDEAFRNRGLAKKITKKLISFSDNRKIRSIALFGTAMGESLYRSLGFETSTYFQFMDIKQRQSPSTTPNTKCIREIPANDFNKFVALDTSITNENRAPFLKHYMTDAIGYYEAEHLVGYYLPSLNDGPILATNQNAGIELLKYKIFYSNKIIMIPEENQAAYGFLKSIDATFGIRVPRMHLYNENKTNYNFNFGRGAGYCG